MPAAGLKEIDRTLRKVDEGIREFSTRFEQNRGATCSLDKEAHKEALRKANAALQKHGAQIKKWTSQGDESWKSARTRLEDAMAKIEEAARQMAEIEATDPEDGTKALSKESSRPKASPRTDTDKADEPSDVKVQADQLLREACEDSDMVEEFVCKICQVHVVDKPKLTRCSHLFCGDCIKKWFAAQPGNQTWAQRAQQAGSVPCPVCKEPLSEQKDLFPVCAGGRSENAMLWRMLCGLKICCSNSAKLRADGRCDWTGEYGTWQRHVQHCQNVPMKESKGTDAQATHELSPAEERARSPSPEATEQVEEEQTKQQDRRESEEERAEAEAPESAPAAEESTQEKEEKEEEHGKDEGASAEVAPADTAVEEARETQAEVAEVFEARADEAVASDPAPAQEAPVAKEEEPQPKTKKKEKKEAKKEAKEDAKKEAKEEAKKEEEKEAPKEKKEKGKKEKDAKASATPEAPAEKSSASSAPAPSAETSDPVIAGAEAAVSGGDLRSALAALVQLKARQWTREHAPGGAPATASTQAQTPAAALNAVHAQRQAAAQQGAASAAVQQQQQQQQQWQQQQLAQQRQQALLQQQLALQQQHLYHQQLQQHQLQQQHIYQQQQQQQQAALALQAQQAAAAQKAAAQREAAAAQHVQQQAAEKAAAAAAAAEAAAPESAAPSAEEVQPGKVLRVLTPFNGSSASSQLQVEPGDAVQILERHSSGWIYGIKLGEANIEGWFPHWALQSQ